ncbi:hypothetical protein F4825DRAFT_452649 [Nemania diffusa]|nr:hypothetical protein F4825DRAFT_452649 [Nemania diffusa]
MTAHQDFSFNHTAKSIISPMKVKNLHQVACDGLYDIVTTEHFTTIMIFSIDGTGRRTLLIVSIPSTGIYHFIIGGALGGLLEHGLGGVQGSASVTF